MYSNTTILNTFQNLSGITKIVVQVQHGTPKLNSVSVSILKIYQIGVVDTCLEFSQFKIKNKTAVPILRKFVCFELLL